MTTAAPPAAAPAIRRHSSERLTGSMPVVGSSRTSSSGSGSSAIANASLWRIPPESWPARRSRAPVSRVRSSRPSARRPTSSGPRP